MLVVLNFPALPRLRQLGFKGFWVSFILEEKLRAKGFVIKYVEFYYSVLLQRILLLFGTE